MQKVIFLALVAALVFQPSFSASEPASSIKAGALLSLSGPLEPVGKAMRKGMELGLADSGTGLGIVYEDDESMDKVKSLSGMLKMLDRDSVDLLLSTGTDSLPALEPALKERRAPLVLLWDYNRKVDSGSPNIFALGFSTEAAGSDMAAFAREKLKAGHVAVITGNVEWSEIISEAFIRKFKEVGGTVDFHERIDLESKDLRTLVLKVKEAKSEAIYFPIYGAALVSLVQQLRQLRFEGNLLTADACLESDIQSLGAAAEGMFITQPWLRDEGFRERLQASSGAFSDLDASFAGLGYDSVMLMKTLLEKKKARSGAPLLDLLQPGLEFEGTYGRTVVSKSHAATKRENILMVRGGKLYAAPLRMLPPSFD